MRGRREVLRGVAEHTQGLAGRGEVVTLWRRMIVEVRERSSVRKSLLCRCTSAIRDWISRSSRWYSRRVLAASSFSSSSMPVTLAASRALLPACRLAVGCLNIYPLPDQPTPAGHPVLPSSKSTNVAAPWRPRALLPCRVVASLIDLVGLLMRPKPFGLPFPPLLPLLATQLYRYTSQ